MYKLKNSILRACMCDLARFHMEHIDWLKSLSDCTKKRLDITLLPIALLISLSLKEYCGCLLYIYSRKIPFYNDKSGYIDRILS